MTALAKNKAWSWCEVRPDVIIGFVPNNNVMCVAQTLAIFLSLFASIHGKGSQVPFPGTQKPYKALFNPSCQDTIARFSIYASLNPSVCGSGRAFNVADNDAPTTWSSIWPTICSFFGLEGSVPDDSAPGIPPLEYIAQHRHQWDLLTEQFDLRKGSSDNDMMNGDLVWFLTTRLERDRHMSLKRMRAAGFHNSMDEKQAWFSAFERFRDARIIP